MWAKERHQRILAMLKTNSQASALELSKTLGVSRETIRRDLLDLARDGQINRVHGGAVLNEPHPEAPFEKRKVEHLRAKQEIARKAVGLLSPGASLFIDAGTTTSALGHELAKLSSLMIVTNSLEIAITLNAAACDNEVILLGGKMMSDVPATFGELTLSEIRRFNLDFAFVSPVGIHPELGAFSFDYHESEVASAMFSQSRKTVVLADFSKLGQHSRVRIAQLDDVSHLVSDKKADAAQLNSFRSKGVHVL